MTTLLYLSPQFPPNFRNFICRAAARGVKVLGIGSDEYDWLPTELKLALSEYWKLTNINDTEELLASAKALRDRHGPIDTIESHNEFWFLAEGMLRDAVRVSGMGTAETFELQKKSVMKDLFKKAGVATVPGKVVKNFEEAKAFFESNGSKVVLKPNRGVGAAQTYKVETLDELAEAIKLEDSEMFIEKFMSGTLLTYDGLTDANGEIVYSSSFTYSKPVMELVNQDEVIYYYTAREIPADLEAAGRGYLKQINFKKKFFHIEFFRSEEGTLYGLEANLRAPGGPTIDLWNYADDIDLYDGWAQIIAGEKFSIPWKRAQHACYIGRKSSKHFKLSHNEVVGMLGARLLKHEPMPALFHRCMGDYCYIFRSESEAEIHELSRKALECVE